MAMTTSSHTEEAIEDHEEDEGPLLVSKLEVIIFKMYIFYK